MLANSHNLHLKRYRKERNGVPRILNQHFNFTINNKETVSLKWLFTFNVHIRCLIIKS